MRHLLVPLLTYLPQGYVHRQNPLDDRAESKTDLVSDPRIGQVTTRMVLNHTTGLPNWSKAPLHFDADPGATWQYSGEGYMLLQRAVEMVTGQSLDAFMRSQVFEPLSMQSSAYTWGANSVGTLVPTMASDGTKRKLKPFAVPVVPTSLYTSAPDYGRFVVALLNDRAALEKITASPVTVSRQLDLQWGLGWAIERADDGPFIWHWGNNLGYRSFVMASVRTGDGFVMFTDSDDDMALAEPIAQAMLAGKHKLFDFAMLH
ncbi:serine hydrolase domain-containing protein [Variovorax ginsengisoli]|nr:serine hydrolase domain-containing protein [Variovorax ginsengisoli]